MRRTDATNVEILRHPHFHLRSSTGVPSRIQSVDDERVIALSRRKLILMIAGTLLFVAAGVWFLVASDEGSLVTTLGRFVPPWFVHRLGAAAALFGLAGAGYGIAKSRDEKPGLILNSEGMVDNSSAVAAGFIPWSEVTDVDIFQIQSQRMLVVHVADPGKYVERGSALKRALNRANAGMCGSPIVISSNAPRDPVRRAAEGGARLRLPQRSERPAVTNCTRTPRAPKPSKPAVEPRRTNTLAELVSAVTVLSATLARRSFPRVVPPSFTTTTRRFVICKSWRH